MKKRRIQDIAALMYENNIPLGNIVEKHSEGTSIETEIKEISEKISIPEEEIKEFLKRCFTDFKDLT
jgi:hypothetical protein